MKSFLTITMLLAVGTLASCKKSKPVPPVSTISYSVINRTVKAADPNALGFDINNNGTVDYSFFCQLVGTSEGYYLYVGINPIGLNAAKMEPQNDNNFLNMGAVIGHVTNSVINNSTQAGQEWGSDFGYLAIRHTPNQGNNTHQGVWGNGDEQLLPLKLNINGAAHYGWARLVFNKSTEVLTLIDCAWEQTANKEIKAGQK